LSYAWPLIVAVWAAVAYRGRQTLLGLLFAGVGFAGVALIFGAGRGIAVSGGAATGYLAALASAGCMAFYTVMAPRIRTSSVDLLLVGTIAGTILSLIVVGAQGSPWHAAWSWTAAVYVGVGPLAAGYVLWSRAMSGTASRRLAPVAYATPLLSTLLLILAGRTLTGGALAGALLVLVCSVGVLVTDYLLRDRRGR